MFCWIFHPGDFSDQTACWIPPNGGEKLWNPAQDDFYGRAKWGITVSAWDICIFFDLTHGLFWNLWVYMMGTNRLYGKFHNLTRRNILNPHPPRNVSQDSVRRGRGWMGMKSSQEAIGSPSFLRWDVFGCSVHSK